MKTASVTTPISHRKEASDVGATVTVPFLDHRLLAAMFESLPSATILVFSTDAKGQPLPSDQWPLLLNQRARQLLCLFSDAAESRFSFQDLPRTLAPLIPVLQNHSQPKKRKEIKLTLENGSGQPVVIGYNYTALEPGVENEPHVSLGVWAFMFTDITQVIQDRLAFDRLQQELFQSKKLAALGTMISGVAHELNNPLAGISMRSELAKMAVNRIQQIASQPAAESLLKTQLPLLCGQLAEGLVQISENCNKASILVSDLLNYSRNTDLELEPHPLVPLLQKMVQALKSHTDFASIPLNLVIANDLVLPPDQIWVRCEPVRLEQVFYNLVKNARDALLAYPVADRIPQITLTLSRCEHSDQSVCVQVQDNGPGIDAEILGRIFDPFFSTKGAKGLGLGLSISYRTVEQHGGTMQVQSQPTEGTTFCVSLPLDASYQAFEPALSQEASL